MKNKVLYIVVPVLLLAVFTFVMHSDVLLKHSLGSDDDLYGSLKKIEKNLLNGETAELAEELSRADKAWAKIRRRIMIGVSYDEVGEIDQGLARLRGCILGGNYSAALIETCFIQEVWRGLGN